MTDRAARFLICDDDPLMRKLLTRLLGAMACDVVGEAVDGDQGVKMYKQMNPDVVLLDINMPGKNGVAALRDIRKVNASAKVIMLTAMDDVVIAESCLHNGALGYVRKGGDVDSLSAELQDIIDQL